MIFIFRFHVKKARIVSQAFGRQNYSTKFECFIWISGGYGDDAQVTYLVQIGFHTLRASVIFVKCRFTV